VRRAGLRCSRSRNRDGCTRSRARWSGLLIWIDGSLIGHFRLSAQTDEGLIAKFGSVSLNPHSRDGGELRTRGISFHRLYGNIGLQKAPQNTVRGDKVVHFAAAVRA
jgi:hypothetical protein